MIDVIEHDRIRELRLNRPPVNALDLAMLRAVAAAVEAAAAGSDAIVITGQPGLFSAGLDVPALLGLDESGIDAVFVALWRAQRALAFCPVPVVFGLTGHSPAGGTVLAIHGDYRVMAEGEFRLGLNEVQVGLYPGPPIHGAFARLVGGHAAQLLTRGALIDPATALRVGLVDELCESTKVAERALAMARELTALPRAAMTRTRDLTRQGLKDLFGEPAMHAAREREFAALGVRLWFADETQALLRRVFVRRSAS